MHLSEFVSIKQDRFVGKVRKEVCAALDRERLLGLQREVESARDGVLASARHRVVVLPFEIAGEMKMVAVKSFGRQQAWKDRCDFKRGTKAARSLRAARFLEENGVGTPLPLGSLERWEGKRLKESYFFSVYLEGLTSLKTEFSRLLKEGEPCDVLVSLLEKVGSSMRRMHDAGFFHRDLGNQNIELGPGLDGQLSEVNFIDLNRGRIRKELTMRERALDFARLKMPSGFLDILVRIYWQAGAPSEFRRQMKSARRRFEWWVRSRRWRHPIRSRKKERSARQKGLAGPLDVWVWDRKSAQAAITLDRADRKRCQSVWNHLKVTAFTMKSLRAIRREYRRLKQEAFQKRVEMNGCIGMALEPADLDFEPQRELMRELGKIPVLLRFGHHEGKGQWEKTLGYLENLHADGHEIMVAVLQDRRAILQPKAWSEFLHWLIPRLKGKVSMVEIGHVINRVKWGVHNLKEYASLLEPVVALQREHPDIPLSGPACIDFEFHHLVAGLGVTPDDLHYRALSHHLYVDRRGAPENKQGKFGTVEKAALLKAIAETNSRCDERVILSEVNWPLQGTGVWSPVAASYLVAGTTGSKVHVTEQEYGQYMLRYLALVLCSGFVDQVFWWRLVAHGFGLVDERSEGGWRKRVGFRMLQVFLKELGHATFVGRMQTEENVYALQFERDKDLVTMVWCHPETYGGPWPVEVATVLSSTGEVIELEEIGGDPVYFISGTDRPRG